MEKVKSSLISLAQILLVLGAIAGVVAWKFWKPGDKKILAEVSCLANAMCECTDTSCADAVSRDFAENKQPVINVEKLLE